MNRTGLQAEQASRLIQIFDDLEISQESVEKAMLALSKNGIDPTIENLARLSDAYLALAPGADQVKFLVENMGKAGADMARAMEMGSAALLDMNNNVDDNLVLSQRQLEISRANKKAADDLTDTWEGFKITMGASLAVPLTHAMDLFSDFLGMVQEGKAPIGMAFWTEFAEGRVAAGIRDATSALNGLYGVEGGMPGPPVPEAPEPTQGMQDAAQYFSEADSAARSLAAGLAGEGVRSMQEYETQSASLREEHAKLTEDLIAMQEDGVKPTDEAWTDLNGKIKENEDAQRQANAQTRESINLMIFQKATAGMSAESTRAVAVAMGIMTQKDSDLQTAIDKTVQKYDLMDGSLDSQVTNVAQLTQDLAYLANAYLNLPEEEWTTVYTEYITIGSPPSGSGGGGTQYDSSAPSGGGGGTWTPPGGDPMTAEGGTFRGAQWRVIGEAGPEAVIPLKGGAVPVTIMGGGLGTTTINYYVVDPADVGDILQKMMSARGG
jgi:hypothetical protein